VTPQRLTGWDRGLIKKIAITGGLVVGGATLTLLTALPSLAADATLQLIVNVEAQPLEAALVELSRQAHLQLVIATGSLPSTTAAGLHGRMTLGAALDELLIRTGLTYRLVGEHTIAIVLGAGARTRSDPTPSPGEAAGEMDFDAQPASPEVAAVSSHNNESQGDSSMKHHGLMARMAAFLGICMTASGGPACAQSAAPAAPDQTSTESGFQLQEVVVTARKQEESLDRVPVAVSVIGADQLRNNLSSDLTQIAELAPQVSMSQGGSGTGGVITVRGVSSGSNDAGLDQSVAIEVDNIPISRGQILSASTFDLAQVQVLEGPQALFFGKNSPAGVIALQSANPTDKYEGYITPGYEFNAAERFIEAALSGPLTDTLKARVAFRGSTMNGWIQNVAQPVTDFINPSVTDPGATNGGSLPMERRYAGRLTLIWTPSDSFDASFKLTLNHQHDNAGNATSEPFCTAPTTVPTLLAGLPLPGADCQKNEVVAISADAPTYAANMAYGHNGVPSFDSRFMLAALNLNKRFDWVTLTSTSGYYDQTVTQASVSDWSPYATIFFAGRERYALLTQELRANTTLDFPVNFMGGVYYEHFDRPFSNSPDLFHTFNPLANNYSTTDMVSYSHGSYISGFAQARWNILPQLELSGGARYSHDEKRSSIYNIDDNPGYPGLYPDGQVLRSDFSDNNVSPEATLSWHPQQDQTLYVAYKTGYKDGGISNGFLVPANATPENVQFRPEKSKGEEIGFKAALFDRRLRLDLTAYRYNYDDLQVVSYNAQTISFSIGNAASARIQGIEGSFDWLAYRGLTFRGNMGFNHARYESYSNAQCFNGQTAATGCLSSTVGGAATTQQNLTGKALLRAPDLTYGLGGEYQFHLAADWGMTLSVNGSHSGSYQTATDYSPGGLQDAYWLLDAAVHLSYKDRYEIAFLGRDLTNTYYTLNTNGWSGSFNPNQYAGFFNRPREVVLQATARF
jgi:iron complex outermembrane receptor protein